MDRPKSSAHLQPKSKTTSTLPPSTTTATHRNNNATHSSHATESTVTSSPETPPTRRGGWTEFSPIKLSPLKFAPSSPHSSSSRDHSPSRDSPDLFEAHTQLDQSPSSSPATPVVYQGSTPPLTPPIDTLTRDTLQREVTQLDLGAKMKTSASDKDDRSLNDRSLNDRSMTRLLRMETRLDVADTPSTNVTGVKPKPALLSVDTTADLTRTSTVLDVTKNSHTISTLSHSAELLSRATTLLDIPLNHTVSSDAVKWQLIGQGALSGHVIELQEGSAVQVGRGPGCVGANELSAHKVISAVHISLVVREQHCWLTDVSSNGTWLNGLRLETQLQTPLRTGDLVELVKHNKGEAIALLVRAKRVQADQGQSRDRDKKRKKNVHVRVNTMADERDEELITRLVEDEIILRRYGNLNEGQYHAKQREIDKLWQQDEHSLHFLRDSLRNSNDVTNKMVGVLKTFDDRLKHLLGSIQQIHHSTTKWKNVYKNIDSGLSNFKDVIELFDTAATAKPKLSSGVSAVGVNEYLEVMDKLQTAISYFMNNTELKSATKTLEELQRLQADATAKLKAHYEQVLRSVSSPADPTQLRVDVTESKSSREVRMTSSGQVLASGSVLINNEQTLSELNKMIKRLDLNKESSYLSLYTTIRSEYMLATLAKLQPHKMLQMFADSEATTSGYMRGTHPCIQFISVLLVLLFTERNLIARLLPSKHVTAQLRAVIEPSMQQLSEITDGIIKLQRRNANRQYAVCVLLDLWAHVNALNAQYAAALLAFEDEDTPVKRGKTPAGTLLSSVITKFSEDLTENTREILSEVKGQWSGGNSSALSLVSPEGLSRALAVTSWSVPSDGTVAQQTVMAVQFLSALFPYKEIVVNLLPTLQPISGKSPLAVYIIRSLEELIDTMETRAKKEKKSQALTAIYLLNNFYFIWKGVKSNAELAKEVGSQVLDGYQKRVEEQKELYKRTWSKCSEHFEDRELKIAQGSKLHSAIKHCLSGFNAEFEDNFSNQVQFFIADDDLRTALRGELMALLVPPYKQFLSKYGNEEFAAKKDKYLKYSAESLEGMIGKFFDGALTKGKQLLSAATNN